MKKKIVWLLCSALLLTILSACGGTIRQRKQCTNICKQCCNFSGAIYNTCG